MFTIKTGKVVVDADLAKTDKVAATRNISYEVVDGEKDCPSFADLCAALVAKGFRENPLYTGEGDSRKSDGKSLAELLAQGFRDFGYTSAVAREKKAYTNSPDKVLGNAQKELTELLNNPDLTPAMRAKVEAMLASL